jgi:L-rhamnose mutarotase
VPSKGGRDTEEEDFVVKRYGMVIKVKPEKLQEYRKYHTDAWPDVLNMIRRCNIRNYSIYHKDGCLFSYFEYHGEDFQADMEEVFHTD